MALWVPKGYRGPDPEDGVVGMSGRARLGSSHPQVLRLGALGKWAKWILDIKNAFAQAGGFQRDVLLRAQPDWDPNGARRIRKLQAPAYGLADRLVASRKSPQRYLLRSNQSLSQVSPFSAVAEVRRAPLRRIPINSAASQSRKFY